MKLVTFSVIPAAVIMSALSAVVHTALADGCDVHNHPCDGTYIINDEPGMSRFYVHEYGEYVTPWERVSIVFFCGTHPCSKSLAFAQKASTTVSKSQGETFTVGESHSDTNTSSFAHAVKGGLGGKFFFADVNADYTFTKTNGLAHMDGTGRYVLGQMRTYQTATGTTLSRTGRHTCQAEAGEKLYLVSQLNWLKVKGNYCVFNYRDADNDNKVWSCQFLHAQIQAVIPGTNELDVNLKCVTEKDGQTEIGCRSADAYPTYAQYCLTNRAMGHISVVPLIKHGGAQHAPRSQSDTARAK